MQVNDNVRVVNVTPLDVAMTIHKDDNGVILDTTATSCYVARNGNEHDAWWLDTNQLSKVPQDQGKDFGQDIVEIIARLFAAGFPARSIVKTKYYYSGAVERFYEFCLALQEPITIQAAVVRSDDIDDRIQRTLDLIHYAIPASQFTIDIYIYDFEHTLPLKGSSFEFGDYTEKQHYTLEHGKVALSQLNYKE